jgi:putative phosphoesterase
MSVSKALRVGLVADTHGLLRTAAKRFAAECDYLIHAGDIGSQEILDELSALAPLTVVKGNNDQQDWAARLPQTELIRLGGVFVYVIHDIATLAIGLSVASFRVIVSGHSHKPSVQEREGILYVNPGSCGPRRFKLPISVGELLIDGAEVRARTMELSNQ